MRNHIRCMLLWLTISTVCSVSGESSQWPGLLGSDRNGWVNHFQIPKTWPDVLSLAWKVEVGDGYGTPVLHGDQVYQHARQKEDEVLWRIDFKTGDVVWRQNQATAFQMGSGGESHGKGPKSSPIIANGKIFTLSVSGTICAWDIDSGKLLWQHDENKRFSPPHPYWGASISPIVENGKLLVRLGNDASGLLLALDTHTGQKVWSLGDDGACYSSPIIAEVEGVRQLIEWNHNALIGVDVTSGTPLWRFHLPHLGSNQNMPTPSFHQASESILVGGENRGVRRIQPRRNQGKWVAEEIWHQKRVALDMSTAVLHDNHLFGFSHFDMGQFFCIDLTQGTVRWKGPSRTGENAALLAMPGHIAALINDGTFWILSASPHGFQKLASYQVADLPTWAPPVLWHDSLLVKDRRFLMRWSFNGDAP
ncbi:MAG: PQQ-like beta-propeller repeat protein [Verrucomicrobiota bacterium]|nr:PQQ-like beta-propeller repeat protein [Verrucomicrobiota bacterium]